MLSLRDITVMLNGQPLIKSFSIDVADGKVITVMGASGSGKSSLLSYIGGDLDQAFIGSGDVILNDVALTKLPPEKRHVARLFQDDLLFPHMTVAENLMFAVPALPRAERQSMVEKALQRAELSGFGDRAPHTLSGGQRQRVALMRALLSKPAAILLDEPFSKLDIGLREQMRNYVYSHITARGIPALLVTHDREDAPKAGRVLRLNDGEV
jgi:putative thiamine transport system ATP-binding protein